MMKIVDGLLLSEKSSEYLEEIKETWPDEKFTEAQGINYAMETLKAIEGMLRARDIDDPVDFITGLSNGSILIVKP